MNIKREHRQNKKLNFMQLDRIFIFSPGNFTYRKVTEILQLLIIQKPALSPILALFFPRLFFSLIEKEASWW